MKEKSFATILILVIFSLGFWSCSNEPVVDIAAVTSQPKDFVGSNTCKTCHLEHFDSWKMTLHSRMLQDVKANEDSIIVSIDETAIRADLAKLGDKLKVPADKIYVPKKDEILYTIGSQWKQRYLVKKEGMLYIAPVQYNADTHRWVNYEEADWDKRPWLLKCGGCHATGADLEKNTFREPGVGCEACHGKGSWHAALPKTAVFEKRNTILNPAKLTMGIAAQICGSCHNRGQSTMKKGGGWPVGYEPGKALASYYQSTSFGAGDKKHVYSNEFSKSHHMQYIDWQQSIHADEGVTCTSCHYVHQLGMPPTRSQTDFAGSKQCLSCHEVVNNNLAHSIHSFANCVGCHMPKIAKSAESGDIRSHVFVTLLPEETIKDPAVPNSCQACHKHKNQDIQELQKNWEMLTKIPKPVGQVIEPIKYKKGK